MVRALTAEPQADADLLRDFRDLFRLTLDEVAGTGISRRTWARIEAGEGRDYAPTVRAKVSADPDIHAAPRRDALRAGPAVGDSPSPRRGEIAAYASPHQHPRT